MASNGSWIWHSKGQWSQTVLEEIRLDIWRKFLLGRWYSSGSHQKLWNLQPWRFLRVGVTKSQLTWSRIEGSPALGSYWLQAFGTFPYMHGASASRKGKDNFKLAPARSQHFQIHQPLSPSSTEQTPKALEIMEGQTTLSGRAFPLGASYCF